MLVPGMLLLMAAVFNLAAVFGLWRGKSRWQWAALVVNAVLALYLVKLVVAGVSDHPIGVFLAMVCSQLVVLLAVLAGLKW